MEKDVSSRVTNALKKYLETRGYDAAGLYEDWPNNVEKALQELEIRNQEQEKTQIRLAESEFSHFMFLSWFPRFQV
jgi:hypothetical protein